MDLTKIKHIINEEMLSEELKEDMIINIIASDKKVFTTIIKIIESERKQNDNLITDMNLLLSKAHIGLEEPIVNKNNFIQQEIIEFYHKYKDVIGHCFKNIYKQKND